MNHDTATELPLDECWELLRAHAMGRLAFHLADEVHITPINYVVAAATLGGLVQVQRRRGHPQRDQRAALRGGRARPSHLARELSSRHNCCMPAVLHEPAHRTPAGTSVRASSASASR